MIRIYTDAAVKGDPGPAGAGILIVQPDKQTQLSIPLRDEWNNHQAEFQTVILALEWVIEHNLHHEMAVCYTDSQIVSQSIEKQYAKDKHFKKYVEDILSLMASFEYINIKWIPQLDNKGADNLARQALRKALKLR